MARQVRYSFTRRKLRLDFKATPVLFVLAAVGFVSNSAFGDNLNLTGTLNVNDTQMMSTTNLLLSLIVTLAESVIPILVGAAVGHKSMRYWQEKKDGIATKNNILANYAQSFKRHGTTLDNFVERVFRSYIVFQKEGTPQAASLPEYSSPENNISGYLRFPPDSGQLPTAKFGRESYGPYICNGRSRTFKG